MNDYLYNPAAYGSIPNIPASSTATSTSTAGWTPQFPNYPGLASQASGLAGSLMAGQIPKDVLTQMQQQAAERGVAIGDPYGANANASYLRALGLTSLGLEQQGMQNYLSLLSQSPRMTTQTGTQTTPNDVLRAIYAAAPDPFAAAMANLEAQRMGLGQGESSVKAPTIPMLGLPGAGGGLARRAASVGTAGVPYEISPEAFSYATDKSIYAPDQGYLDSLYGNLPAGQDNWIDMGGGYQMNALTGEVFDANAGQSAGYLQGGEEELPTYSFSDVLGTTPEFEDYYG